MQANLHLKQDYLAFKLRPIYANGTEDWWKENSGAAAYFQRKYALIVHVSACSQVQYGVQAVFGPSDPLLGAHIHSICDALDIPHLEARLDLDSDIREFSINLYPAQHLLNAAFQDVMSFLNWTKVAIVYEEDYGRIAQLTLNMLYIIFKCLISTEAFYFFMFLFWY